MTSALRRGLCVQYDWHLDPGRPGEAGLGPWALPRSNWAPGGASPPHPLLTAPGPQVQSYMEHYCNNSTDRRILLMFLDTCAELGKLCQRLEALHSGTPVTNNLLEKCKALVSQSNDLSSLRAKRVPLVPFLRPWWRVLEGRGGHRSRSSAEAGKPERPRAWEILGPLID